MSDTKARLNWIMTQLDNLYNGGNIRYDGDSTFQGVRGELSDIINTYVDNSEAPAPVTLQVVTADQLDTIAARLAAGSDGIVTTIKAAISDSQGAVIDALKPAPAAQ